MDARCMRDECEEVNVLWLLLLFGVFDPRAKVNLSKHTCKHLPISASIPAVSN